MNLIRNDILRVINNLKENRIEFIHCKIQIRTQKNKNISDYNVHHTLDPPPHHS